MQRESLRTCPLCDSFHYRTLLNLRFSTFEDNPLEAAFPWVVCTRCGFSFYATSSTLADFDAYYGANAYYCTTSTAGSGGGSSADLKRFRQTAAILSKYLEHDAFIMDVGCGKGGLLGEFKRRGFTNLIGVDVVPECVEFAGRHHETNVAEGSAYRLPRMATKADCLVYSHVLEHALDPRAVLFEAHSRLSSNGIVYVEVPDAGRYGEGVHVPFMDLYIEHINHFDRTHLLDLMNSCGFKLDECGRQDMETPTGGTIGCEYGVFRKVEFENYTVRMDSALERQCRTYVERCLSWPILKVFEDMASSRRPVYVWGMSQLAQLLLGQTVLSRCKIKGLIDGDRSKQGKMIGGRVVSGPEELSKAGAEDIVLLTGVNYESQMLHYLEEIDFRGEVLTLVREGPEGWDGVHTRHAPRK